MAFNQIDGSHLKKTFHSAYAQTMLAWGALSYMDGYESSGEAGNLRRTLKWGADYLMASHPNKYKLLALVYIAFFSCRRDNNFNVYPVQIGNDNADKSYCCRPEEMTMASSVSVAPSSSCASVVSLCSSICFIVQKSGFDQRWKRRNCHVFH